MIEIAAKRSPIGKPMIFLIQTARLRAVQRAPGAAHALLERRRGGAGGGGDARPRGPSAAGTVGVEHVRHLLERRLATAAHRLVLRGGIGEVDRVAHHLQRQRRAGEQPDVVAVCDAPIARPAKTAYSLVRSKIESSQAPSLVNVRV